MVLSQYTGKYILNLKVFFFSVNALRHLKDFFEIQFKIDEWNRLQKEDDEELRLGSNEKALVTAMGIGYSNLNKTVL